MPLERPLNDGELAALAKAGFGPDAHFRPPVPVRLRIEARGRGSFGGWPYLARSLSGLVNRPLVAEVQRAFHAAGIDTAVNMTAFVNDTSIVLFARRPFGRLGRHLATLTSDDLESVDVPYVGGDPWHTTRLLLKSGTVLEVQARGDLSLR